MNLANNYAATQQRLVQAALAAQRDPSSLQLIAVSKTFPADDIRAVYVLGQRDFGETISKNGGKKPNSLPIVAIWFGI